MDCLLSSFDVPDFSDLIFTDDSVSVFDDISFLGDSDSTDSGIDYSFTPLRLDGSRICGLCGGAGDNLARYGCPSGSARHLVHPGCLSDRKHHNESCAVCPPSVDSNLHTSTGRLFCSIDNSAVVSSCHIQHPKKTKRDVPVERDIFKKKRKMVTPVQDKAKKRKMTLVQEKAKKRKKTDLLVPHQAKAKKLRKKPGLVVSFQVKDFEYVARSIATLNNVRMIHHRKTYLVAKAPSHMVLPKGDVLKKFKFGFGCAPKVTQCIKPQLMLAATPRDILQSSTDAAGFAVPCMGYVTLCGFVYPVTYIRFFYMDGVWSHVQRLFINNVTYITHHLVADAAHIYVQVKDIMPKPKNRKAQSGGRANTNSVCGLYTTADLTQRISFNSCLPKCVLSPKDNQQHMVWFNQLLQDNVGNKECNLYHNLTRSEDQETHEALFAPMDQETLCQFTRAKNRQGPVFQRSDWRKHKESCNPCPGKISFIYLFFACFLYVLVMNHPSCLQLTRGVSVLLLWPRFAHWTWRN
jgi:hypothetical protein